MKLKVNKVLLAYLAVCFFWGSTYLAIRIGVKDLPPFLFAGIRFLIAGSIMLLYSKVKNNSFPDLITAAKLSVVGLLLLLGGNGLVVYAEKWVHSGVASLILSTVPLFIALIEIMVFKQMNLNKVGLIGLIIGFSGVAILTLANSKTGSIDLLGCLLLLSASFFWSLGSTYSKTIKTTSSIISNIGIQMLAGGVALTLIGSAAGELSKFELTLNSALSLVYLIMFGSIVGYSCYIYALKHWPASRVGTYAYINPVVAVFLGAAILNESLSIEMFIPMSVILIGVFMVQKHGFRKKIG